MKEGKEGRGSVWTVHIAYSGLKTAKEGQSGAISITTRSGWGRREHE